MAEMSDTKASGRFLLRLEPGLHAVLRTAAAAAGVSLNEHCARKLAAPGGGFDGQPGAEEAVARAARAFGDALIGVVLFGSWARGEAGEGSDVDLLMVVDDRVPLTRELYREWDASPVAWDGHEVEPAIVHLPAAGETPSGFWAEVALDGIVLFARDRSLATHLSRVRRAIAAGRIVRREAEGQVYWVEAA